MRILAAWLSNPVEFWPNIFGLVLVVAIGVFVIRRIQARRKV